jgi:hypothetical protein
MALSSLGVEDGTAGTNVQSYLRGTQQPDGSFPYMSGAGDTFDSAYAIMALAGGFWPGQVYDGPIPSESPSPSASPSPSPAGSVLGASTGGGSGAGTASTLPDVGSSGTIPAPVAIPLGLMLLGALWQLGRWQTASK